MVLDAAMDAEGIGGGRGWGWRGVDGVIKVVNYLNWGKKTL